MTAGYKTSVQTPVGALLIRCDGACITEISFSDDNMTDYGQAESCSLLEEAARQLQEYFKGIRQSFSFPFFQHGTLFQQQVWQQLLNIPFGDTCSYRQLAQQMGNPNAMRAVGLANGQNRLAIVVPCHRVIGSSGRLVGYSGGLHRKQWLLRHELSLSGQQQQTALF